MEYPKNISSKKDDSNNPLDVDNYQDNDEDNESEIDENDIDQDDENNSNTDNSENSDIDYDSDNPSNTITKTNEENIETNEGKTINNLLQTDISQQYNDNNNYESSDDDDYDNDNFKKLEISRHQLKNTHNNLQSVNYIEVEKLSKIVRDENNIIIDDYHKTLPILSKYEKTKILGLRTKQINRGAKPFISVNEEIIDGYIIAERELMEKKLPFIIKRPISNNKFEYWRLQDLEIV